MSTSMTFAQQESFAADRLRVLGGSDVANLYNLAPYYCERRLAYFKILKPDGTPMFTPDFIFYGNKPTKRGQMFERLAADLYSDETNRDIRKSTPKADAVVSILRPQPDFDIINDARGPSLGRGILSIKAPGREMFLRLRQAIRSLAGGEEKSDWQKLQAEAGKQALLPYELQLQAEIGAQKSSWGSFGLLHADSLEVVYADYDRDEEIIADIRVRSRDFWDKKEKGDIEAFPRLDAKSTQCGKCEFRISCQSQHLLDLLNSESESKEVTALPLLPILDSLRDELREREAMQDEAKELVDETKNIIRETLNAVGADAGEAETTRVYNRLQKGKKSFQKDPMFKFLKEKAGLAEKALELVQKEQIVLVPSVKELLDLLVELPTVIEDKFISTGKPFRVLKILDIRRNLIKGTNAVQ